MTQATPRRDVLVLGAAAMATVATGCTVYGGEEDPPAAEDGEPEAEGDGNAGGGGEAIASTSDVDVGGGLILSDQQVVITQPAEGEFRGFSAVCTHQGCTVGEVIDGTINCPCHGSRFSIEDGSVVQAAAGVTPDAQDPLPEVAVTVDGDDLVLS